MATLATPIDTSSDNLAASQSGTVDTLADAIKNKQDFVKYWLGAIALSSKVEKDWREDAKTANKQYRTDTDYRGAKFNILFANIQTTVPAIFNSMPASDVRARFGEAQGEDPNAQQINHDRQNVSNAIERFITVQADMYDYYDSLECATKDRELLGRAVTRVRLNQMEDESGNVISKHITREPVIWDDFRLGPAKRWPDTPWIAFRWLYTRDELEDLSPKIGPKVKLDATLEGAPDKGSEVPDTFKRAVVWEIWDRAKRQVYFIAEGYKYAPLKITADPYRLLGFWPIPKPLLAIRTTDSQVPVCPFIVWQAQQAEMNDLTRRIGALIKVIRWRGIYAGEFEKAVQQMKNLDEGELAPAPDSARMMAAGGIEKAFWLMPIREAIETLKQLYESREVCKQVIYELTGVADILRGSTKANETLGAQKLKAEWGSLRLQSSQQDIQIHARDLDRMTADLMAEHFSPQEIQAMTGIALSPEQHKLLKSDMQREFNIDIETDGTIKADLSRAQENVGAFVQGFGGFIEAVGPAVQAGMMTPVEAAGLLRSFARNFKLGREAENILDEMQRRLEEQAKQPPQPPPPDPKVEAEKIKAGAAAADAQASLQQTQIDGQVSVAESQARMQELAMKGQQSQAAHAQKMQQIQAQGAIAIGEHVLAGEAQQRDQQAAEHGHALNLQTMDAKAKAAQAMARMKPKGKGEKK